MQIEFQCKSYGSVICATILLARNFVGFEIQFHLENCTQSGKNSLIGKFYNLLSLKSICKWRDAFFAQSILIRKNVRKQ